MNPRADTARAIAAAVAALGPGPLTEEGIARHVAPLFSRVLARHGGQIYLANHSLGRPLDATADDVAEAVALWQSRLGDAWDAWSAEIGAYRARLAALLHAPRADCVVPKTSAGQGLRAILNSYDSVPRVVATRGEFDSIDVILKQYAHRRRIELAFVEARADGMFAAADLLAAVRGADLVVVSQVLFNTGQVAAGAARADRRGACGRRARAARRLSFARRDAGRHRRARRRFRDRRQLQISARRPGRGLPVPASAPSRRRLRTLDIGWFAKKDPFGYRRPDPPEFARRRRRLAGIDAAGADLLPGARRAALHAGDRRRAAARVFAGAAATLVELLAERGVAADGGTRRPRRVRRRPPCTGEAHGPRRSRARGVRPTRAASICACAPTC